jgi:predicted ATP-grasp superfamily ATP-dependent carboligase
MKLLVFEYACAGGEGGEPFLDEGRQMLANLLQALSSLGLERVTTLLSPSLGADSLFADKTVLVNGNLLRCFAEELAKHDAVWIIAPECDGVLLEFTRKAESSGKAVIGPTSAAVEICGDKLLSYKALEGALQTPKTSLFTGTFDLFPCVVKLIDGAGCHDTILMEEGQSLDFSLPEGKFVVQPYVEGIPMSAGVVSNGDAAVLLGVSRQIIETGPVLTFQGVVGPVEYRHKDKIAEMIRIIREKIPGLDGYWGLDFIDGANGPVLIEINPRLTSSFFLYCKSIPFELLFPGVKATVNDQG